MLEWEIIEQRPSAWGSPSCIVAKKDGSPRFCVDYRNTLNKYLTRKSRPLQNMDACLDAVGGARFITVADVMSAFWQLKVAPSDIEKTAFTTPSGKYVFLRMPFGVMSAPWLYQRMMSIVFGHLGPDSGILCYIDGILCISNTFDDI